MLIHCSNKTVNWFTQRMGAVILDVVWEYPLPLMYPDEIGLKKHGLISIISYVSVLLFCFIFVQAAATEDQLC